MYTIQTMVENNLNWQGNSMYVKSLISAFSAHILSNHFDLEIIATVIHQALLEHLGILQLIFLLLPNSVTIYFLNIMNITRHSSDDSTALVQIF